MSGKIPVLISQCLLGIDCRYDGGSMRCRGLEALMARCELIPVCPEILGGLPTPRPPSERRGDRIVTCGGEDVTAAFCRGAAQACRLAELYGAKYALLKARSPSCGVGEIYDGTFSGRKTPGDGVTAVRFKEMGIQVFNEEQTDQLMKILEGETSDDSI